MQTMRVFIEAVLGHYLLVLVAICSIFFPTLKNTNAAKELPLNRRQYVNLSIRQLVTSNHMHD